MSTKDGPDRVEELLEAAADRTPALAALAAALGRVQAADAALVELGTLPPADMVATIRLRATGEPS